MQNLVEVAYIHNPFSDQGKYINLRSWCENVLFKSLLYAMNFKIITKAIKQEKRQSVCVFT